jgi:hypothetical protein
LGGCVCFFLLLFATIAADKVKIIEITSISITIYVGISGTVVDGDGEIMKIWEDVGVDVGKTVVVVGVGEGTTTTIVLASFDFGPSPAEFTAVTR